MWNPAGFVLAPVMFNIYMRPLSEIIHSLGVESHQYANDTLLTNQPEAVVTVHSHYLEAVVRWLKINKQKLNPYKMG